MSFLIIGRKAFGKTTLALNICPTNQYLAIVPSAINGILYSNKIISTDSERYLWDSSKDKTIILDGCMLSSHDWISAAFNHTIFKKNPIIITSNYIPDIDLTIFDYVFLFQEQNKYIKHNFYTKYAKQFLSKEQFEYIMDSLLMYEYIIFDKNKNKVQVYHTKI